MNASHEDFSFACGGSVPIALPAETSETESQSSSGSSSSHETASTAASNPHQAIDGLLADMLPATFGLGGKDVYDESYRKAAKLDPSSFSTNFSPYETGIIAMVAQMLLPDIEGDFAVRRAVKAELYKLNVYEGPSGHFHAHVDTPRSRSQFGSLVVCLPAAHEGGMLEVRHNGKAMQFDCDEDDDNGGGDPAATIKWAAFYSDCEHEVFEVRAGHRVTLTYNLYAVPADTTRYDAVRAVTSPLVGHMDALLGNKDFMPKGEPESPVILHVCGYLGFYTTHAYAHTSDDFDPSSLKGVDMVIWQGFQRLGCGVCLRPILNADCWDEEDGELIVGGEDFSMHISECELRDRDDLEYILDEWDKEEDIAHADIAWLNEPGNTQAQLIYTAYGNEAFATAFYSWCSIIIGVPPYGDEGRMALAKPYA
ncbi:oxidoreductase [Lasiosphaeria ovina]|uniref:Oxidoreductase n=1 Tax=Lasiosphaeria ovina TaxID=92902 RepID=A0AAE0JU21_9PEZI|nr:oxidoreductase [Lasiosphaeria ovina]